MKIGVFESDACSLEVNVNFERSAIPILRGWQKVLPKCHQLSTALYGATYHETVIFKIHNT